MTKRVNILTREIKDDKGTITQRGGIVFRVSQSLADNQNVMGYCAYTSKQKLKSLQKRLDKSEKNYKRLVALGLKVERGVVMTSTGKKVGDVLFDSTNGKVKVEVESWVDYDINKIHNKDTIKTHYGLPGYLTIGYRDRVMPIAYDNTV